MQFITEAGYDATDRMGVFTSKLLHSFVHPFIGNNDRAVRQHIFNHAEAQWKAMVQQIVSARSLRGKDGGNKTRRKLQSCLALSVQD